MRIEVMLTIAAVLGACTVTAQTPAPPAAPQAREAEAARAAAEERAARAAREAEEAEQLEREKALQKAYEEMRRAAETIRSSYADAEMDAARAKRMAELLAKRENGRPHLGVMISAKPEIAGVLVIGVTPGGPAEEAGVRTGDIITHFDGEALRSEGSGRGADVRLVELLREHAAGDRVELRLEREEKKLTVEATLRAAERVWIQGPEGSLVVAPRAPRALVVRPGHPAPPDEPLVWMLPRNWLGLELVELNPELGEYFGVSEGVLVVRASSDGGLGLKGGDVLTSVDGREVSSPSHALRILRSYEPGETVKLEVVRGGRGETLTATVPEDRVPLPTWESKDGGSD